jgi:hypothetical protein
MLNESIWEHQPLAGFYHVRKLLTDKIAIGQGALLRTPKYGGIPLAKGPNRSRAVNCSAVVMQMSQAVVVQMSQEWNCRMQYELTETVL